jgi:hypothetical protein
MVLFLVTVWVYIFCNLFYLIPFLLISFHFDSIMQVLNTNSKHSFLNSLEIFLYGLTLLVVCLLSNTEQLLSMLICGSEFRWFSLTLSVLNPHILVLWIGSLFNFCLQANFKYYLLEICEHLKQLWRHLTEYRNWYIVHFFLSEIESYEIHSLMAGDDNAWKIFQWRTVNVDSSREINHMAGCWRPERGKFGVLWPYYDKRRDMSGSHFD